MTSRTLAVIRMQVRLTGTVQGVGFRPFVWREATARGLTGWVSNDPRGVVLEVEGPAPAVGSFRDALKHPPPLARVLDICCTARPTAGGSGFVVRPSGTEGGRVGAGALVSPDTATCEDCLRELQDPADRRYGYPFVNCTSCGPRLTIVASVPYDRASTTMAAFAMCPSCQAEYDEPSDRRFHAEATCCPACGPSLTLIRHRPPGDPYPASTGQIADCADLLRAGAVVAVKGLGGYHLAVDATQEAAVARLRARKHREHRPFAVMVVHPRAAEELCEVDDVERAILTGPARPIVLLQRRPGGQVADSVAPGSPSLGLMLPYTPLHVLLLQAVDRPLVLTSGNLSDEPIAFLDGEAMDRLEPLADAFLVHDRPIRTRVDDSVTAVVRGRVVPIRRSRGYVPNPLLLPVAGPSQVLACGAALKSTFCLTRDRQAFVSQHIGDLTDYQTLRSYEDAVAHLQRLLGVTPQVLAHDLHPDYPSTRYAQDLAQLRGLELVGVQHHHAHIASCLADNGVCGPVIGVAFDGLGLGTDGSAWGGEFLVADLSGFRRVASLAEVPMPGGDAATRQPWRMAAAHLDAAYDGRAPTGLAVAARQGSRWEQVVALSRSGLSAPRTSSAGRLFDAVSALLGVRDVAGYEGQAAIELEHLADPQERGSYPVEVSPGEVARVQVADLVRAVVDDIGRGEPAPQIAARFHNAVADLVLQLCCRLREEHGLETVALSGGVFQNRLLLAGCLDRLQLAGLTVLTHREVPANDGGISLGQAAVASCRLRARP